MFKNYRPLWWLLLTAMTIFCLAECFGPDKVGDTEVAKTKFVASVTQPRDTPKTDAGNAESAAAHAENDAVTEVQSAPRAPKAPADTASKTILFIGDSMLDGLSPRLAAYASHNGHKLYSVIWYSSSSEIWGKSGRLKSYISRVNPDYIFICLGANELNVRDIAEKRERYVRKIVGDIGAIPFVWIGPPNWKEDTGINDLIAANVPAGSYFRSKGMNFERRKDGAHPTQASAALWMDSVARWVQLHSAHPIALTVPAEASGRPQRVFVHYPDDK